MTNYHYSKQSLFESGTFVDLQTTAPAVLQM